MATVNIITTSEGGDNDNALSGNRNAFAYNAISGTISTDDCYSGEKAALIRTVGWGAGNSAAASSWGSGFGTCKNVTAGELFLGTLNPVLYSLSIADLISHHDHQIWSSTTNIKPSLKTTILQKSRSYYTTFQVMKSQKNTRN